MGDAVTRVGPFAHSRGIRGATAELAHQMTKRYRQCGVSRPARAETEQEKESAPARDRRGKSHRAAGSDRIIFASSHSTRAKEG